MGAIDHLLTGQIPLAAGTSQQITGMPTNCSSVILKNTSAVNKIYVGKDTNVSATTGFPIDPGESLSLEVLTPNKLWIIGTAADRLAWLVVMP